MLQISASWDGKGASYMVYRIITKIHLFVAEKTHRRTLAANSRALTGSASSLRLLRVTTS